MSTANTNPILSEHGAGAKLDLMSEAMFSNSLSLRYISARARKVPKLKRPALIWLNDAAKGGRGPEYYHAEFLNDLFESAEAAFIFPHDISKKQEQDAIDAALRTGCAVVVITTPRCVEEWAQVLGLGKKQ
jgi:hypothetical protein